MLKRVAVNLSIIAALFFINISQAFAQNTTLEINPQTGTQNGAFSVDVVIDGHGDKFNAAEATVELNNLSAKDLTLGNCQFSFLKTPTKNDPSFSGILLSKYSENCTVYSINLIPIEKGQGSFIFSDASVKQYGDASEILSNIVNGEYTLTTDAVSLNENIENQPANSQTSDNDLYVFDLKIIAEKENQPLSEAEVTIKTPSGEIKNNALTDSQGSVTFENLESGIYMVSTEKEGKVLGENIINASGPNKRLSLNIKLQPQPEEEVMEPDKDDSTSYILWIIPITILCLAFLFFMNKRNLR